MRRRAALTRRALLKTAAASAALTAIGGIARPSLSFAPDRPQITHGVQSGDVSADSGVVWARADRPARMLVEVATTDSFRDISSAVFVDALPEADFTAKALIENLPPGQDIFYRVSFQDLSSADIRRGAGRAFPHAADRPALGLVPVVGRHRGPGLGHRSRRAAACAPTPPCSTTGPTSSSIAATTSTPTARSPRSRNCPTATIWRNIVTEEKSKPAETLAEYRGNYKYNLLDDNLRAFNAAVPTFAQWDDHEVMETWWPDEPLPLKPLGEKNTLALCRARRAAPSTNSCRCARPWPSPAASIAKSPTARCSTCSCSTCAAIAARTGRMATAS